jgi:hypothetical protein
MAECIHFLKLVALSPTPFHMSNSETYSHHSLSWSVIFCHFYRTTYSYDSTLLSIYYKFPILNLFRMFLDISSNPAINISFELSKSIINTVKPPNHSTHSIY